MIDIRILEQPDDQTCGPTSLHAVYDYFGLETNLVDIIRSVNYLEAGGTLAVHLGLDALHRGFSARLYAYNLKLLDPTWSTLPRAALIRKLWEQRLHKRSDKFLETTAAYLDFLEHGGSILFDDLTPALLKHYFQERIPILAGLSATYLYQCAREHSDASHRSVYDDIRGEPVGHFVVLCGFEDQAVLVADPYRQNPITGQSKYKADLNRVLNAIMLGILTYDANLLIIAPAP